MEIAPDLESWTLFLVMVVPGLISMHVYRLLFAAKEIDWKSGLVQALFYSSLNLAIAILHHSRLDSRFRGNDAS